MTDDNPKLLRSLWPVATLDEIEAWEERAAIKEFCGRMSRPVAEREALEELEERRERER